MAIIITNIYFFKCSFFFIYELLMVIKTGEKNILNYTIDELNESNIDFR